MRSDACAHECKIDEKSFPTRFVSESRDRSLAKSTSFDFGGLKTVPKSCQVRSWGALGGLLGALGALLGDSWALLGRSWGALGALLGRSWTLWGHSWALWGTLGRSWSELGSILGPPRVVFGRPRVDFGPFGSPRSTDFGATTTQRRNTGTSIAK